MVAIFANWLIKKVVRVWRFNDTVMKVSIVIRDVVCEVVSCYCPQTGRSVNKKKQLYEPMDKVVASEKMLVGGDFNDYFGGDMGMILFDWAA